MSAEALPAIPVDVPEPVPVDQVPEPRKTAFDRITAHREAKKHPVVVPWLKERDERDPILRWALAYGLHIFVFHAVRIPIYQWRLTHRAPVGLWRVIRWVVNGLTDAEARPLRLSAVERDDPQEWRHLAKERNARFRHRSIAAIVLGIPVVAFLVWLVFFATGVAFWVALLGLVDVLGVVGRSKERPLITRATTPLHLAPVLRAEVVEVALRALPGVVKKDGRIEFPDPITRDGPGYLARVNLPVGVTPQDVMNKRAALASGLRRPVGCVWPAPGPMHGGQLDLWVGDQDLATARQPAYPLLERGTADLFGRLPYGTNQRNGKVGITLMENNVLIGAMAGQGKTSAMRVLALGCALDVTAELRVWEMKGSGDLGALEQIAHTYGSGQDDETIRGCLEDLKAVRAEVERRAAVIKKIAKATPELCPNNKVTRELANRRDLGLHPLVMLLDEVQNLYSHETYGKEAAKVALDLIRLGRAFGVILVEATQRPDADSLPKGISSNAGIRIALRVMDDAANNMILGAGMYGAGIRATDFGPKDKGVAWLVGVEDEPLVSKSYNITTGMAERVCARARKLREEAGRLTGYAADQDVEKAEHQADGYDLLADLQQVMGDQGRGWLWNAEAAGALGTLRPGAYDGLTAETLGVLLAKRGVKTKAMHRNDPDGSGRKNLVGFTLDDLVEARRSQLRAT